MNQLNSIIFEGYASDIGDLFINEEFRAVVTSQRYIKVDDHHVTQETHIEMYCDGKVGLSCQKNLRNGRGIRVVGRLAHHTNGNIIIYAEHVEFKPIYSKGESNG